MTRPSLKSRFGEQIRAFVGYKNSLGFPYDESIRILGRFDDFCVERFPEKDCLDCELALAWLEKRDTENTAGHRNRIMVIREFAKYLRAGPYTKRWTEEMFWRCFSMAGITAFEGPKPRVYDFRHTFATECICRWMREGRDIDAMLPFLSAYMGHARYEDTLYYVHMVPDFYERVGTVDRTAWEKLLPEVHDEG